MLKTSFKIQNHYFLPIALKKNVCTRMSYQIIIFEIFNNSLLKPFIQHLDMCLEKGGNKLNTSLRAWKKEILSPFSMLRDILKEYKTIMFPTLFENYF